MTTIVSYVILQLRAVEQAADEVPEMPSAPRTIAGEDTLLHTRRTDAQTMDSRRAAMSTTTAT